MKPLAPIGPNGEAVIDLLVSDGVAAGFGRIVLVLHPETGPAVRYHVERCWPDWLAVTFTEQRLPLGTVHAVLAPHHTVGADRSFTVCNADDIYGEAAMRLLADQLEKSNGEHVLIGYPLRATVATDDPVTRGICVVGQDGHLTALTERRQVARSDDGATFTAGDGLQPASLPGDLPTSVNLWGFRPAIWTVFSSAMEASALDEEELLAEVAAGGEPPRRRYYCPRWWPTWWAAGPACRFVSSPPTPSWSASPTPPTFRW